MFVRKKPNKSGTVSVQVVQKTKSRKQLVVKSFGSARPDDTVAMKKLMQAASLFLQEMAGPSLPHIYEEEDLSRQNVSTLAWTRTSQNYAGWSCRDGASSLGETWVSQCGKQEKISGGRPDYLRTHEHFKEDIVDAVIKLEELLLKS